MSLLYIQIKQLPSDDFNKKDLLYISYDYFWTILELSSDEHYSILEKNIGEYTDLILRLLENNKYKHNDLEDNTYIKIKRYSPNKLNWLKEKLKRKDEKNVTGMYNVTSCILKEFLDIKINDDLGMYKDIRNVELGKEE